MNTALIVASAIGAGVLPFSLWLVQVRWTCPFRPSSYDVFLSQPGLQFFPDQKRALRKMLRLSKTSWAAVAFVIHYGVGHGVLLQESAGAAARMATQGADKVSL